MKNSGKEILDSCLNKTITNIKYNVDYNEVNRVTITFDDSSRISFSAKTPYNNFLVMREKPEFEATLESIYNKDGYIAKSRRGEYIYEVVPSVMNGTRLIVIDKYRGTSTVVYSIDEAIDYINSLENRHA